MTSAGTRLPSGFRRDDSGTTLLIRCVRGDCHWRITGTNRESLAEVARLHVADRHGHATIIRPSWRYPTG